MRKFLKYLAILALTVFLVDTLTLVSFDRLILQSKVRYTRMQFDEYDIAILGNSRGVNSVSEGIFENAYNVDIINLSHNGLNKSEIFHLAGRVRDSTIVFIECSSLLMDKGKIELNPGRLNVFSNLRKEKFRLFKSSVFNHEIFLRSLYYLLGSDANWTNDGVMSKEKLNFLTLELDDTPKAQLYYRKEEFHRLYSALALRGITPVFYVAPIRAEYVRKHKNWNGTLAELESDFPHFMDLSFSITDIESFADLMHTNKKEIDKVHNAIYQEFKALKIKPTNISAHGF